MKKKVLLITMLIVLTFSLCFIACSKNDTTYTIVAPDGAPALSIASFMNDGNELDNGVIVPSVVASSEISTKAVQSDFAVVPANLAANLYNKGTDIKVVAVVTNGNLYMISSVDTTIANYNSLKGKMVYSIGQGSVPDFIFQSLLIKNSIEYVVASDNEVVDENKVNIKYCADGSEVISSVKSSQAQGKEVYGILGEPAVSMAVNAKGLYEALNLQQEWKTATNSEVLGFAQAVLIAKGSICNDNPKLVKEVISKMTENETFVKENASSAVALIKNNYEQSALAATLTNDVVVRCNIKTLTMNEYKDYYNVTLQAVADVKIAAIGGKIPDEAFYFVA